VLLVIGALVATPAAGAAEAGPSELPSAFFISKSDNHNQVHYAVAVDANCLPAGVAPVRPYWRMLEQGPGLTAPLLEREQQVYGIATQTVTRSAASGSITLALRALPQRPLTIVTRKDSTGTCRAAVYTVIQSQRARLYAIHVVLGWIGVDSLIIKGWARSDGHVLRETIEP